MADIATLLNDFGGDTAGLRLLGNDGPDLLPYATLLAARRAGNHMLGVVSAVYEWQGRAADLSRRRRLFPKATISFTRLGGFSRCVVMHPISGSSLPAGSTSIE
jgi:hypothetical protein